MKKALIALVAVIAAATALTGCGGSSGGKNAEQQSQSASNALQGQVYQSKHNIEFRNYNLRQKISDDPSTIVWCTFFPPGIQGVGNGTTPGQAFTVPIAGKLTSSNKRPYRSIDYRDAGNYQWYPQEVPGPDHMYGASSEYRYGFDPTLTTYYDFTDLPSFCTTEPTIWQSHTTIVADTSASLTSLTHAAEAALKKGDAKQAAAILKRADNTGSSARVGGK